MSDNIEENIREKVLENQSKFGSMGNLQHSINRSLEFARNNKPTYQKGETKSSNHQIFEMNEFYMDMAQKINELNLDNNYGACFDDEDDEDVEDTESVLYDVVTAIRKRRNNPAIRKQIDSVLQMDKLMEDTYKSLRCEKAERQSVQKELCQLIDEEDDETSRTRLFKALCDMEFNSPANSSKINQLQQEEKKLKDEYNSHNQSRQEEEGAEKDNGRNRSAKKDKDENKFIKRNIELAKNTPTMYDPSCSLTDEEKVKLELLLTDLDNIPESNELFNENLLDETTALQILDSDNGSSSTSTYYPFSLSEEDQAKIQRIDEQLEAISELNLLAATRGEPSEEDLMDDAKYWSNQGRLKHLNEKLQKLQSDREKFTYEPYKVDVDMMTLADDDCVDEGGLEATSLSEAVVSENDTFNAITSLSYDTVRERSQEMVRKISKFLCDKNIDDDDDDFDDFPVHDH